MKYLVCLTLLAVISVVLSETVLYPRGCIYVNGHCHKECEEGTHGYATACGYLTPEPTCDEPNPQPDTSAHLCDFSACYCDAPTVRDPETNKCVALEHCKKKE